VAMIGTKTKKHSHLPCHLRVSSLHRKKIRYHDGLILRDREKKI
jgi:hypothetical protein